MIRYCPICDEQLIYDPFTGNYFCMDCEFVAVYAVNAVNLGVDKTPNSCYARMRPNSRGYPVPRRMSVIRS